MDQDLGFSKYTLLLTQKNSLEGTSQAYCMTCISSTRLFGHLGAFANSRTVTFHLALFDKGTISEYFIPSSSMFPHATAGMQTMDNNGGEAISSLHQNSMCGGGSPSLRGPQAPWDFEITVR